MEEVEVKELVRNRYGYDSYTKGMQYPVMYIDYYGAYHDFGSTRHVFRVESESTYTKYRVTINVNSNKIVDESCGCMQFEKHHSCKHIAAIILHASNILFPVPKTPINVTSDFLKEFYEEKKAPSNTIKEKLNLDIELDLTGDSVEFKLQVGLKKLYVINNSTKFDGFMDAYLNNKTFSFGVNFVYDGNKYYFDAEDDWLINFLHNGERNYSYNYYYRNNDFLLNKREANVLFDKLKDRSFKIKNHGQVKGIISGFPTELDLNLENEEYKLTINDKDKLIVIDDEYKYIIYNKYLYIVPETYQKILKTIYDNEIEYLAFKKEKVDMFKNGLLKKIQDNIKVADNIDEIVVSGKPEVSLYFDLKKDQIKCDVKLKYRDLVINYFDKNDSIIRDEETENKVISDLLSYNFNIDNKNISLIDFDDIGAFLTEGLSALKEKYQIYTSVKLDNMNVLNQSSVKSNFSIGANGIMSYDFNVDNIDLDELDKVLSSLKANKRYYKLKNGDLLNLQDNDELQELSGIVNDLDINLKDLESGNIEVPKYRAFYIDSLKNNKYKSINTDSSFDTFINNFKKYQNIDIALNAKDKKILRNYQVDGVKWLYTLYKCDLGGILADEMGLGKSIQTIYFVKQVLKEKKDAKILIVCPTALVYNWKKEFDMFGSELKYVTVADNKEKRKEVIKHFKDYNIFITSYGLIRNDNDEYEDKDFEVCIIDEAQAIKNNNAGLTKEVKKIKARTKIALTGTPLENSVLELWSIFDFILPGYLNSILKFREKYGIKDVDEESLTKLSLLNYQIKPFILRRKKQDVIKDLPDKIENNIYLELPETQKAVYVKELNETKKEFEELLATEGMTKARFKLLTLLMKLRQLCVDPSVLYENYKYESIKLEKLLEMVKTFKADGHKVLVFSNFKRVINHVKELFDEESISNYVIDGEVKSKERMMLVERFNNDATDAFLITLKSGGVGLNLTGADIVIHLDIWWNPQVENQATDRAHRIGQTKKVTVIRLITKGTIEERIIELQNKKRILSENLIEGKSDASILNNLTEEEMKKLLSYGDDDNE